MLVQDDYTVRLDSFEGPLDLLLFLIRRAEVDILDIPVATITDQYLAFLKGIDRIDVESAGEFLVMAATLMEIKSRLIAPKAAMSDAEGAGADGAEAGGGAAGAGFVPDLSEADPRYELVRQLMAYKAFREAAAALAHRMEEWRDRRPAAPALVPEVSTGAAQDAASADAAVEVKGPELDLEDVGVWDLFSSFQKIIEAVDFGRLGDHAVEYDDTPIKLHEEDLLDQLNRATEGCVSLRKAFEGRKRGERLGLFLAALELVRRHQATVKQDRVHDDIVLTKAVEGEGQAVVGDAAAAAQIEPKTS